MRCCRLVVGALYIVKMARKTLSRPTVLQQGLTISRHYYLYSNARQSHENVFVFISRCFVWSPLLTSLHGYGGSNLNLRKGFRHPQCLCPRRS